MQLLDGRARAFEIRPGDVKLRTRHSPGVDHRCCVDDDFATLDDAADGIGISDVAGDDFDALGCERVGARGSAGQDANLGVVG